MWEHVITQDETELKELLLDGWEPYHFILVPVFERTIIMDTQKPASNYITIVGLKRWIWEKPDGA